MKTIEKLRSRLRRPSFTNAEAQALRVSRDVAPALALAQLFSLRINALFRNWLRIDSYSLRVCIHTQMGVGLMADIHEFQLSRQAQSDIERIPRHLVVKLLGWIDAVGRLGLRQIRLVKGFHDEPPKGARSGQRSLRLNRAYRAIYEIRSNGEIEFVSIEEVNKHDY